MDVDGDIWVYDLSRGTGIKLPKQGVGSCSYPVWAPDGRSLAFSGVPNGGSDFDLFRQAADGHAPPELLGGLSGEDDASSFTPDGHTLIFCTFDAQARGGSAVWRLRLDSKGPPDRLSSGLLRERSPRVSPDGRLIAYQGVASDHSDHMEIFWSKFPDMGAGIPVSGGAQPRWSEAGREIFFRRGPRFYVAPVGAGPEPSVGEPRLLFECADIDAYDVLPDGSGLIALRGLPNAGMQSRLRLVTNWFEELRRLAP
ncbi:MAG TPA: hypothetical protein VGK93_10685 [Candidatus Eisenbacteria bacterium]